MRKPAVATESYRGLVRTEDKAHWGDRSACAFRVPFRLFPLCAGSFGARMVHVYRINFIQNFGAGSINRASDWKFDSTTGRFAIRHRMLAVIGQLFPRSNRKNPNGRNE